MLKKIWKGESQAKQSVAAWCQCSQANIAARLSLYRREIVKQTNLFNSSVCYGIKVSRHPYGRYSRLEWSNDAQIIRNNPPLFRVPNIQNWKHLVRVLYTAKGFSYSWESINLFCKLNRIHISIYTWTKELYLSRNFMALALGTHSC